MKMLYNGQKTTHNFAKFKTIGSFGDATGNRIITVDMANGQQKQLAKEIGEFFSNRRLRKVNTKREKKSVKNSDCHFSKEKKWSLKLSEKEYFRCL